MIRLAAELYHQPGRDHDGNEEGKNHRGRGRRRDGAHVGTHHAGHEEHGQQRRDNRKRCHDGRVADFGHRIDCGIDARAAILHGPVAGDILDHHDGVIDENADREDECEQADAVQRIAHDARGEEGEQDGGGNDHRHHQRLAPADGHRDEDDDGDGGKAKVEQEFVGFFVGGLAIVPRDGDGEVLRDQRAFELFQPLGDALGDDHGIGAGALGQGQRNGGQRGGPGGRLHHIRGAHLARIG